MANVPVRGATLSMTGAGAAVKTTQPGAKAPDSKPGLRNTFPAPPPVPADGVTVIVAVTGAVPGLVALNDAILPVPLATNPIDGVLFVQLKVVPATVPLKFTGAVEVLLHTTWLAG